MNTNQFMIQDNQNQILQSLQIITEKILPEKIKKVVWNKKIDLIGINCGKYFEIHRIGYKHEEIFKKEENCEIKEILFFDSNYLNGNITSNTNCLAAIILEDTSIYFINCSTCEIILKTKNKIPEFFQNIQAECFDSESNLKENKDKNPFNHEINFNSFSKIEVSYLNFLENYFDYENCFVFNKNSNQIDFYLKFLINYGKIQLDKEIFFLKQIGKENSIFYMSHDSDKNINFSLINLNPLFDSKLFNSLSHNSFYLIYFSLHIIDYVTNIFQIFSKIIYKLSIIFFDKFIFANNLEHELNDENEKYFKEKLNKELKNMMYFGNISPSLKNLLNKDLFEGKSMLKIDENIHFNLKNIEEISIENIKPCLDILTHYLNQIKYNLNKFNLKEEELFLFKKIENNFEGIFLKFEDFLSNICSLKMEYRNFLAWLNIFNTSAASNESVKNSLSSLVIDYNRLFNFIDLKNYNMNISLDLIESKKEKSKFNLDESERKIYNENFSTSSLMSDNLISSYIKENNLENLFKFSERKNLLQNNFEKFTEANGLKNKLNEFKEELKSLKEIISKQIEREIKIENILKIALNKYSVKNVKMFNQNDHSLILLRIHNELKEYLLLIRLFFPKKNLEEKCPQSIKFSFSYATIKLIYENVSIMDYDLHKENDLLFLVKTNITESNSNSENLFKQSVIVTQIDNYNFSEVFEDDFINVNELNFDLNSEEIKIDKFSDVECSDNSFISAGYKGLIGLIDNKKNKIIIIDI